jgi:hypothetical protein
MMETMAKAVEGLAAVWRAREIFDPFNRHPKEEPFKRYIYDKPENGGMPYRTEWPTPPDLATTLKMKWEAAKYTALEAALRTVRIGRASRGDPVIDDHLLLLVQNHAFGMGF